MAGKFAGAAFLVASTLAAPPPASAQGPYWESKPLSYWVMSLSAADPLGRVHAATSVAEMAVVHGGGAVASAVPGLLPNLADPLADVRESAARALEQIGGPTARPAVPTLLTLLSTDIAPEVRRRAALALGRIDPTADAVVAVAGRSLRGDRDTDVRVSAAVLLFAGGRSAEGASSELAAALSDDSRAVRLYAAAALARTPGGESAWARLIDTLDHDPDSVLRAEAVALAAETARGPKEILPALVRALGDPEPEVRGAAADALGAIGKAAREALPALGPRLRDPDEDVREKALRAVRQIRRS